MKRFLVVMAGVAIVAVLLTRPAEAHDPAVKFPPQSSTDCSGDTPIVVASDQAAQSDMYSAATLAGVIGTDCVVLAGPRDAEMPSDQAARLEVAASDGYVVGGASAVPAAKTEGRFLVRVGGADRWATARLVGEVALQQAGTATPTWAEICEYRSLVGAQLEPTGRLADILGSHLISIPEAVESVPQATLDAIIAETDALEAARSAALNSPILLRIRAECLNRQ